MYSIYNLQTKPKQLRFNFSNEISLAGCNNGIIPRLLEGMIKKESKPPVGWIIPISDIYCRNNQAVIIDIKPKNKKNNETFLCELDLVFGFSYSEWTPVMYRLKHLLFSVKNTEPDKNNFIAPETSEILYTMSYLSGSFKDGQLTGTWNPPGPSATNSLLLWPEAITFFYQQIAKFDPDFLKEKFEIIS